MEWTNNVENLACKFKSKCTNPKLENQSCLQGFKSEIMLYPKIEKSILLTRIQVRKKCKSENWKTNPPTYNFKPEIH
jgi:hypothetical protein